MHSSSLAIISMAPFLVGIPTTLSCQLSGCLASLSVRAHSTTCNNFRDTSNISPCPTACGTAMRSTAAVLDAGNSFGRPRKRTAVQSSSTTESPSVKSVCADHLITTVSSTATFAVPGLPVSSLTRAFSPKIQSVLVQPSHRSSATSSFFPSVGTWLRSVSILTATTVPVTSMRPSLAGAPLSSALSFATHVGQTELTDISILRTHHHPRYLFATSRPLLRLPFMRSSQLSLPSILKAEAVLHDKNKV